MKTKLSWNQYILSLSAHNKQRLSLLLDFYIVRLLEVFSYGHLLTVTECKLFNAGSWLESNVIDDVGPLVTVVSDDTGTNELGAALILEFMVEILNSLTFTLIIYFVYPAHHRLCRHESTTIVHNEGAAVRVLVS